jgi:hypothetical protein
MKLPHFQIMLSSMFCANTYGLQIARYHREFMYSLSLSLCFILLSLLSSATTGHLFGHGSQESVRYIIPYMLRLINLINR